MKTLYKFKWYNVYASIEGLFVCEPEVLEQNFGKEVYFGEIAGKHSEVCGVLEKSDIKEITNDQGFISEFERLFGNSFGYNPLIYLAEYL